jgi:hypothetical protein
MYSTNDTTTGVPTRIPGFLTTFLLLLVVVVSSSAQVSADQCAGMNKEINRSVLSGIVESWRRGEPVADGRFYCRKAFPTLLTLALDPDPKVRDRVTFFLSQHYSPAALQALVRQIEAFPSYESAFPVSHAAKYPCHFFRMIKVQSLRPVLKARVNSRANEFNRGEIYLLGCLGPGDPEARKFLEEMNQPSFPLRLSESDRETFAKLVTYALAEAGSKEAEEKVLAEIETKSRAGDSGAIQSLLEALPGFTNCRILLRYAQLINDKSDGPDAKLNPEAKLSAGQTEIKAVRLRIGDIAISSFTSALGTKVTGEIDNQWRPHSDTEMERVYRRVKQAVEGGKFSTCRSLSTKG